MLITRIPMAIMLLMGINNAHLQAKEAAVMPAQVNVVSNWEATALRVANGNVMEVVAVADSKKQLIALSGIAAPARGQAYYKEARDALEELVHGKKLTVIPVKNGRNGFQIVKIQVTDIDVNAEMVKNGWAWAHKFYNDNPELTGLEAAARKAKIGLWQDENPIEPWEFRQQQRAAHGQQNQEASKDTAVKTELSTSVQPTPTK